MQRETLRRLLKQNVAIVAVAAVVLIAVGAVYAATYLNSPPPSSCSESGGLVQVVAGENFWGSLVSQIGGTHVNVTSIVTDPNTDPHQYEGSTANAERYRTRVS